MKYHFQFVSRTAVRIELIAEDKKEMELIAQLSQSPDEEPLLALFRKGVQTYASNASLTKAKFMSFPKVALCSYSLTVEEVEKVA